MLYQGLALRSRVVIDREAVEFDQSLRQQLFALLQLKVLRLVEGARTVFVNKTFNELFHASNVILNLREFIQRLVLGGWCGAGGLDCILLWSSVQRWICNGICYLRFVSEYYNLCFFG